MNANLNNERKIIATKYLSNIQNEIIYGGYYTALGGPAFIIITSILTKVPIPIPLLIISYLIPLMVYSYDYYKDMDKDKDTNIERADHFNKKAQIYPYLMISYVITLIALLVLFTNILMISYILILITVGVLYTLGSKKLTEKILAFKKYLYYFNMDISRNFHNSIVLLNTNKFDIYSDSLYSSFSNSCRIQYFLI